MNFLKKEYQFLATHQFHWTLIFTTTFFFILFFFIFLPFGVNEPKREINLRLFLELSLFGIPVLLSYTLNELFIRRRIRGVDKLKKFLYYMLWVFIFTGSCSFLLYNYLQSWYDFYLGSYILHVLDVGAVLIFPLLACFAYFNSKRLVQDLSKLSRSDKKNSIALSNSSGRVQLRLEKDQILYFESQDNYVEVHYIDGKEMKSYLLRNTLSKLAENPGIENNFLRVHRSFLVNTSLIESINGTALKSEIKIRNSEIILPVSRNMIKEVRLLLQSSTID